MKIKMTHKFYSDFDYDFVKRTLISVYGVCQVSGESMPDANLVHLHHMMVNSKVNRRKYPFFIDSLFNLVPVLIRYQDAENKIKISEEMANYYEEIIKDVVRDLWIGYEPEILMDMTKFDKILYEKELERIRDYQRTREGLHWNIRLSKRELEEMD